MVLMRYGEQPAGGHAHGSRRRSPRFRPGCPRACGSCPFYDRTPLIHRAIETVSGTVREELIVCTLAILVVMGHLGGAFVVSLTLPMAILFSFLMMRIVRRLLEHHEPGRDRHQRRHPDRPGRGHGRERGASPVAAVRPREGPGRHDRDRHRRLPHRGPADLLLGAHHDPLVPARLRPDRAARGSSSTRSPTPRRLP